MAGGGAASGRPPDAMSADARAATAACDVGYCFRFRVASRQGLDTLTSTNHVGFRCVADLPAPEKK